MNKPLSKKQNLQIIRLPLLVVLFVLLLTTISCVGKRSQPFFQEGAKIDWENETPESVLSRLQYSGRKLTNLTSFFSLSLDPPPKGHFSNLSGILYVKRTKNKQKVRIKAQGMFGRVLFDMVHNGSNMEIYVPSQKTLYKGNTKKDLPGDSPFGEVFESLMVDLSSMKIKKGLPLLMQKNDVIILLNDGGKLLLDKTTGLIMSYQNKKQEIFYKGYQRVAGYPPVPIIIEINSLENNRKARCELRDVNFDDNADNFSLAQYKPRHVKELSELEAPRNQ